MNYRQVHLDFHTSEKIEKIGEEFNKEQFQKALEIGHINSITLFSKCHHGWAYHPSKANEIHPHLKFDLLGAQIEAAHEIGVKTPVYLSAGFDEKSARIHPEWLARNKDDSIMGVSTFAEPGYHMLCLNSPYLQYLLEQIKEVCRNYDADGIFLDIVAPRECYCQNCVRSMLEEGKDPYAEENAEKFGRDVYVRYAKAVREAIDSVKPGLPVFHNGGHIRRGDRELAYLNTHLELESLPTGGWGYDHFPMSAAYAGTLGMNYLGMTGKFHSTWGEFGGFKHPNALLYETALSVANGARCSIGDQLHPSGKMDMVTYKMIGEAYRLIEQKEPWVKDAHNIADIAVLSAEAVAVKHSLSNVDFADVGAVRILLEEHFLFDIIDLEADFQKYKVLILPDVILIDDSLDKKLKEYVVNGGKLLATGKSGLNMEKSGFRIDFGVKYMGENEYCPDYFRPLFEIEEYGGGTSFVMYSCGQKIENKNAKVLGVRENPYFNRSVFEFCSHLHTPSNGREAGAAMVYGDSGIYIGWNVFSDYAENGSLILKLMVKYALNQLLADDKTLEAMFPKQGVVALTKQDERYVLHMLYAAPVKRGKVEVIEDVLPIFDTSVKLKVEEKIKSVTLQPQNETIPFSQAGKEVTFIVPEVHCHQMVSLTYENQ